MGQRRRVKGARVFARRRALVLRVTRLFRLCKGRGPSSKVLRVYCKLLSATDVAETTVIAFPAAWSGPWENQLSPYLDRKGLRLPGASAHLLRVV